MWRDGEGKPGHPGPDDRFLGGWPNRPADGRAAGNPPRIAPPARSAENMSMAQDCCGTIDARSNWDGIKSADGEWRPPLRANSIRRSKALERI
jgi:hypothetical protein